jgi:hypothetical protein
LCKASYYKKKDEKNKAKRDIKDLDATLETIIFNKGDKPKR